MGMESRTTEKNPVPTEAMDSLWETGGHDDHKGQDENKDVYETTGGDASKASFAQETKDKDQNEEQVTFASLFTHCPFRYLFYAGQVTNLPGKR